MKTKNDIRERMKIARNKLNTHFIQKNSKIIFDKIIDLPEYKNSKNLFLYISLKNEVSTLELIEHSLKLDKKVFAPYVYKDEAGNLHMTSNQIFCTDTLVEGPMGILQPKSFKTHNETFDLIIVPGVAFDKSGNRIGFGLGMYDRYFKNYQSEALIVGLAFDFQIVPKITPAELDVQVHEIITEKNRYRSKS